MDLINLENDGNHLFLTKILKLFRKLSKKLNRDEIYDVATLTEDIINRSYFFNTEDSVFYTKKEYVIELMLNIWEESSEEKKPNYKFKDLFLEYTSEIFNLCREDIFLVKEEKLNIINNNLLSSNLNLYSLDICKYINNLMYFQIIDLEDSVDLLRHLKLACEKQYQESDAYTDSYIDEMESEAKQTIIKNWFKEYLGSYSTLLSTATTFESDLEACVSQNKLEDSISHVVIYFYDLLIKDYKKLKQIN